jgi:ribonucleoside-triphosphate reductase (formate)
MNEFIFGTLLHKNIRDSTLTFFVVDCEYSVFRRRMFSEGYNLVSKKEVYKNGIPGLEVVLHGRRSDMQVIKKDKTLEDFSEQKIINAVQKSARRMMIELSTSEYSSICNEVFQQLEELDEEFVEISLLHNIVESVLEEFNPAIAKSYRDYRNYKTDFVHMLDEVYNKAQSIMYIGDKENSNTDSALVSTKRSLIFNQLNKELYQKFFLTTEELQAARDGYVYIHDMSARRDTMNCCLFDASKVLSGGFEMGNIWYNEPKTLDVAFDVIGDIVLSAASQQYGGYTVPEVDKILRPYAEKTYNDSWERYSKMGLTSWKCDEEAMKDVDKEMRQGYQGWEYKFNTVASSRGDYPFITITFGLGTDKFEKLASKTFLQVHRKGQGKKNNKMPVLFPKLVFLYTEDLHGTGKINEDLFEEGVLTSAKTMYPDWLSLDGDTTVSKMYHKYRKVISPMGKCKLAHVKPIEPCLKGVA